MSDEDLDRLMAQRLREMQKKAMARRDEETRRKEYEQTPNLSPRDALLAHLGHRGMEVLRNAEFQYPREAKIVIEKLGELVLSGEINESIDGGKLLTVFRSVGIHVRMQNTIKVEKDGKFVSLSEKLVNGTESGGPGM